MALELEAIIVLGAAATGAWYKINTKMNQMNREIGESKVLLNSHLKNFNGMSDTLKKHMEKSNDTHLQILGQFKKMNGNGKKQL